MKQPNQPQPPVWADRLLRWFCPPYLLEELLGDLHEQFDQQVAGLGPQKARRRYVLEVIRFCRPYFLRRRIASARQLTGSRHTHLSTPYPQPFLFSPAMLSNYLKIALRTLWRSKGYAAINVVGLSVAFCICVFLFLTVYIQLTFDAFHQDGDRIYQAYFFMNDPEHASRSGSMPLPLLPALKADYPEMEAATRIMTDRKSLVMYKGRYFDKMALMTDPDFLTMFSFPLISGNRHTAMRNLSSIVISENMARTVFGAEDPLGKPLQLGSIGSQKQYIVTGVVQDAPVNSSIQYDALLRIENAPNYPANKANWDAYGLAVYIKLPLQVRKDVFESRLKPFTSKYYPGKLDELTKKKARPDTRGDVFAVRLQQLVNVHFDREVSDGKGAPIAVVYVLLGIAFFILAIACINFINLNIARSFTRAREVGVRKSLGALKSQLFMQIWGESMLICLVGFLIGGLLTYLLFPQFNATFDVRFTIAYIFQPGFIALMLGVFVLVTLVAGGYPAWQMARFNPVEVLKGKVSLKRPGLLRNSLIVTQFSLSCLLACCTLIAARQVDYLRTRPLGFDKEQVISIPVGNQVDGRQVLGRLRNKLADDPSVLAITGAGLNLGRGKDRVTVRASTAFTYKGHDVSTDLLLVDYDYLKTLNIKVVSGRGFDRLYASDSLNRVVITESMAKMMGDRNPVGRLLGDDDDTTGNKSLIIGVVRDFHLYSVASEKQPITMHLSNREAIHYIFVRVSPQQLAGSMDKLKKIWSEVAPQSEFMGSFLDQNIDAWYQDEEMLARLLSLAASIAVLLSCSGLFAVALMVVKQRTKEIGIRKVMGASVTTIIVLLSKDFVKLVLIALLISLPLAWFAMRLWLANYAERIDLNGWVFGLVGLVAILIAGATVSFQTIKAALANPVKSLRSE